MGQSPIEELLITSSAWEKLCVLKKSYNEGVRVVALTALSYGFVVPEACKALAYIRAES